MRLAVTSVFEDFSFPLAEAQRKQAWWHSKAMSEKGLDVRLICFCKKLPEPYCYTKEGVKIVVLPKHKSLYYKVESDIIHYIGQPGIWSYSILKRSTAKAKFFTITDGIPISADDSKAKQIYFRMLSSSLDCVLNRLFVLTDFQRILMKGYFSEKKIRKCYPFYKFNHSKTAKSEYPSLLFMGHLSPSKGIFEVIEAYEMLKKLYSEIKLVIANSNIYRVPAHIQEKLHSLPDVTLKGIVKVNDELGKAWIYLYPLKSGKGTFAVPLSLLEAIDSNTFYISSNVAGVAEYLDERFLLDEVTGQGISNMVEGILRMINTNPSSFRSVKELCKRKIPSSEKVAEIILEEYLKHV